MVPPRCPAAYVRGAGDWPVLAEAAVRRSWPVPVVYGERPGQAGGGRPALGRLQTAVGRGRHDGLLVVLPGLLGNALWLMGLLRSCTRHGVTVGFVPPGLGPGASEIGAGPGLSRWLTTASAVASSNVEAGSAVTSAWSCAHG